jgi:hypothetical protein
MTGLFLYYNWLIGALAQLVEQWTLNPFVASSILARPTKPYFDEKTLKIDALRANIHAPSRACSFKIFCVFALLKLAVHLH